MNERRLRSKHLTSARPFFYISISWPLADVRYWDIVHSFIHSFSHMVRLETLYIYTYSQLIIIIIIIIIIITFYIWLNIREETSGIYGSVNGLMVSGCLFEVMYHGEQSEGGKTWNQKPTPIPAELKWNEMKWNKMLLFSYTALESPKHHTSYRGEAREIMLWCRTARQRKKNLVLEVYHYCFPS